MPRPPPPNDFPARDPSSPRANNASLLVLFAVFGAVCVSTRFTLVDDAYISFRYAWNLSHGQGLVFNVGEKVEGMTNLLWTLILSVPIALTSLPVETSVLALSLVLVAFVSLRLWQISPLLGASPWLGTLAASMLLLSPEVVYAGTNGLEAGLYAALLVEIVYRHLRGQFWAECVVAGLLFLTRPEGAVIGLLVLGVLMRRTHSIRTLAAPAAAWIGIIAAATIFRLAYYGTPVPNSIVAKSFGLGTLISMHQSIATYVGGFLVENPHLLCIIAWGAWCLRRQRSPKDRVHELLALCAAIISLSFVIILRNGGDWMQGHRLFTQYGTLYAVALILLSRKQGKFENAMLAVCVIIPALQTARTWATQPPHTPLTYASAEGLYPEVVRRLHSALGPSDTLSAEALGYLSYQFPTNPFHDPLGLTDAYLARHGDSVPMFGKVDATYTLGVVIPSVLVWHWAGHLKGTPQPLLDRYQAFCSLDCDGWNADLVMIRKDRMPALGDAFADWRPVSIRPEQIEP